MEEIMNAVYLHVKTCRGITVLETMVSLLIFMIIAGMVPAAYGLWISPSISQFSYEERVIFTTQLQLDFRPSTAYWTNASETILYFRRAPDNATVQYELYQDKVRRRVNGTGHEVFLQNVKKLHVVKKEYGIELSVTTDNGREFSHTIAHPIEILSGASYGD
ncbi:MAG: ComGF family competence protein [Bacillus sp. (in: Bacteria)]|nr:ComGF family competence protein [Bacillus sp. (in: firmicutes)]